MGIYALHLASNFLARRNIAWSARHGRKIPHFQKPTRRHLNTTRSRRSDFPTAAYSRDEWQTRRPKSLESITSLNDLSSAQAGMVGISHSSRLPWPGNHVSQ